MAHINHRHYIDKILVELMVALSWFNPIAWIIRRELCAVHEFEADRVVLTNYLDLKKYKQFLFEEVSKPSPRVANGFNNSLIKQRFLEMKNNYQERGSFMRKVLSILAVVVVISLSSFTYVIAADDSNSDGFKERVSLNVRFKNGSQTFRKLNGLREVKYYEPELIEFLVLDKDSTTSNKVSNVDSIRLVLDYVMAADIEARIPVVMTGKRYSNTTFPDYVTLTLTYNDGRVEVFKGDDARSAMNDMESVKISEIDNGDGYIAKVTYGQDQNYRIIDITKGEDGGRYVRLLTREEYVPEGYQITVTFNDGTIKHFDGMEVSKVKTIDPTTVDNIEIVKNTPKGGTVMVKLKDGTVTTLKGDDIGKVQGIDPETIERITVLKDPEATEINGDQTSTASQKIDYYDLRRDQIMVIDKDDFKYGRAVAYRRDGYTEVDFISHIFYSKQWFGFSSEVFIIDPTTGERYQIKEIANGAPMNRYARVIEQVGRTVVITLIFPPIPEGLDKINIIEYAIKGQPRPAKSNGSGPWLTEDIQVLGDVEKEYRDISEK